MLQAETVLQELGYPENQVKLYLACLRMGEATTSEITDQLDMPRTSVVELLEDMHQRGLINYYIRKDRKYWLAENPDKLLTSLREKETELTAILPVLRSLVPSGDIARPHVQTYVGVEEIKNIYDDVIDTKHHILAVVCWDDVEELFGKEFITGFIERRFAHFLKMRLIAPKTELSLELQGRDALELRQTRFVPGHVALHRVSYFIYGDKVAIISLNAKLTTGVIIQNADVALAQTVFFESLWSHSSEH